ncbi:MAG: hypothetical protein ACFCVB_02850 [Nodosilinea sp.]
MATSSRRFQSQTVARLVAGYRQVTRSAGQWLRQGRTVAVQGAVWGLQVAVYPIYAAVQGVRLGYRRLRASSSWQRTWARLTDSQSAELVEVDIPIRSLLSVMQPPTLPSSMVRSGGLRLVNRYGRWLRQSQAGAVLTPGQWHRLPLRATVQGIASDLATRRLVLITTDNGVFNDFTDDQQHRLGQAIALMLAEYARGYRQVVLTQHLQQPGLPLPQPKPALFLPLRWLPAGLRWMQTSTLAAVTNLFGEAAQQQETQAIVLYERDASQKSRRFPREDIHPQETFPQEIFPKGFSPNNLSIPNTASHYGQPYGPMAWEPLPGTTSVADAVAMVLATPGAVAVVENSPSGIVPLGNAAATDLAVSRSQQGAIPAVLDGETSLTSGAQPSPKALATSASHQLAAPSALEAKVTQISYIDSPLVALLRGLDWLLYRLETWLHRLGVWLQQHW